MGKEYWYWGSATKSSKKPPPASAALEKSDQPPSPGCISAVFHLFDFHHLHLPIFNHQPNCNANTLTHVTLLPQQHSRPKGGEAPKNSLDESSASLPTTSKEEENLKIPAIGMRVKIKGSMKTSRAKSVDALNTSDADSSPAAKTPNLVARLMGLDIIPDNESISSPSLSCCRAKPRFDPRRPTKNHTTTRHRNSVDGSDIAGIRSLPETPRISASRRSDVDYYHRLSLQLNKENCLSINEDENRSPGLYAKQRVKQIKESVSRKVGIDITNTVKSRVQQQRKDEVIGGQFKSNKISNKSAREESAVLTPSPRPRIVEPKKHQNSFEVINPQKLRSFKDSSTLGKKTRNDSSDTAAKFDIRLKKPQQATDIIRNKQGEPFVRSPAGNRVDAYDRKCKKTPLSPHLLHISAPNLPHVKKDPCPPETKITQKKEPSQAQKPNCGSSRLHCSSSKGNKEEEATHAHGTEDGDRRYGCGESVATTVDESAEREYITNLLRRTGIDGNTVASSATWFSPSLPLDPSVFYCIELDLGLAMKTTNLGRMRHRSNRKLLFDLVDMMLAEFSKPVGRSCGWSRRQTLTSGTQLVEILVSKLRTFPQADCRVLEDIDALVEIDLQTEKVNESMAVEEEAIVTAVEEEILERLVEETAAEICRALKRHRFTGSLAHVIT